MVRLGWFMLLLGLAACSSMQVGWDYDAQTDFSALRTYDWLPTPKTKTGDPKIHYNSLLEGRVKRAVDEQLGQKGFERRADAPDFLVSYNVAVDQKVSVTYLNELYGYGPGWGPGYRRNIRHYGYPGPAAMVSEYQQGTLIIDIVLASNRQLIWRGTASDEVYPDLSPEARQKRLYEAVQKILAQFPPARQ